MSSVRALVEEQLGTGYRYQQFDCNGVGLLPGTKVSLKMEAWGDLLKDFTGDPVLDIGCNLGFFTFLAAQRGASKSIGVDVDRKRIDWAERFRRQVRVEFDHEWMDRVEFLLDLDDVVGRFDYIFMWSVYHHMFKLHPDHDYWFQWLFEHLAPDGQILFEGPFTPDYIIERIGLGDVWTRETLEAAMSRFSWRYLGPAKHTGGREMVLLWR